MKRNNTLFWTITVATAGFLFGFDTVVISGANEPIKELWNTTPFFHGIFIMSMALWGTVIGALFGGIPTDRYGRKHTLLGIGILFFISAIGSALAPEPYSFSLFRFIGGLGVGASTVTAPIYISETSSAKNRGRLVALYQFMLVLGIFIAYFSNYFLEGVGGANDWRWMLGVEGIPALIFILLVFTIPHSPRWLVMNKGDEAGARQVLGMMDLETSVDEELKKMKDYFKTQSKAKFFSKTYTRSIWLAVLIAFFNQMSGINFILYYAPEILSKAGLSSEDSLLSSTLIGGVNLVVTMIGVSLIDRVGRKMLMYIGSVGYIVSMATVSYGFYAAAAPEFLMSFILLFIASHAVGQGAVIWVFISEIFPNEVRSYGTSIGTGVHWVMAAIITLITPVFIDEDQGIFGDNPWPVFLFFAGVMVAQLLWVIFAMPETKGKSLEEISQLSRVTKS